MNEAAGGSDAAAIDSALEELEQAMHALSKHMYEAASKAGGPQPGAEPSGDGKGPGGPGAKDDVIDAEFTKSE